MKRTLIAAALLAAFATAGAVHAQGWDRDDRDAYPDVRDDMRADDDALTELRAELDQLREDRAARRFASEQLDAAEDYINGLEDADREPAPWQVDRAERMLADVARAAGIPPESERGTDREVVVVQRDDPRARRDADRARFEADRARREADEQREAAMQARLDAESERNRNAQMRRELAGLQMRDSDRGLVVTLGDVLFETGKAEIKPGARRSLDQMVRAMRDDRDATLVIEGHTDSVGKRAYNVQLSQRRANAVRAYLVNRGIASRRIEARGMGPDYPVASNRNEAGRQQNRRVEMIVQADD
ncbi:MAG TPA: OmpA family protein [Xanthomonadales bacterium]|nr:OmpA family protein [Xanthomonadales bacterium]